jgi:uncharacterized protein (TIGR02145 family)
MRISILVFLQSLFFFSELNAQSGTMTDPQDGKVYKTVQIGSQIWMAQNLSYEVPNGNSDCFMDSLSNCKKYGRLYRWKIALEVCPSDWRLPTKNDIQDLLNTVEGNGKNRFKELSPGGSSGFNFPIGGYYIYLSTGPTFWHTTGYSSVDDHSAIWTSTEVNRGGIYSKVYLLVFGGRRKSTFYKAKEKSVYLSDSGNKEDAVSVRCVKE